MAFELTHLFSPIRINQMELKNRAVMPPMGTGYGSEESVVTDRLVKYLALRAQGGTGLIMTEVCAVDPRGKGFQTEIGIWTDRFTQGLSKIPEAVHREGGKVAIQLHHAGRETHKAIIGSPPEAPSPIPSVILRQPCEEMSVGRIAEIVEAYAHAAKRAKEAGFDAVEIHGAHGYLIGQFLSPFSNQRSDKYGGTEENRARFAIEIVKAVRQTVGPDYPVLIRVSAEELVPGGYDLKFIEWLAPKLVAAGVDAIHVSVGVYSTPGNLSIAAMDTEEGFNLHRARAVKKVINVPVIGVGRIHDPRLADDAIVRGDADLISFGRQHLADPFFIAKAQRGEIDDIRFCLACNQGCIDRMMYELKPVTCTINPDCGREYEGEPEKVDKPKRVWVVGAGPAGLSAALSALERGNQVTLYEKEKEPGGQLRPASAPPYKDAFIRWVTWAMRQLAKHGLQVRFGQEVTENLIKSEMPEAIILASGADSIRPDIHGIERAHVHDARDVLLGKIDLKSPAVILGAGNVGMETADYLIGKGVKVTLLDMKTKPPVGKYLAHGYWLHKRLRDSGGEIILGGNVTGIEQDGVVYTQGDQERRLEPAPMVVTALGASPASGLFNVLEELGIPYKIVGDAKHPRRLLEAIQEGTAAGRTI